MVIKVTKPEINVREITNKVDHIDTYIGTEEVSTNKATVRNEFNFPAGNNSDRPLTPSAGSTRWNTESNSLEVYNGTDWVGLLGEYYPNGSVIWG